MRVYIALFTLGPTRHRFSLRRRNPGIGGSEFTTIQFAMRLAQDRPDWTVILAHHEALGLDDAPQNLQQITAPNADVFFARVAEEPPQVLISLATLLQRISTGSIAGVRSPWVIWSRHPYDNWMRTFAPRNERTHVVCVGEHQWRTNLVPGIPVHFIQQLLVLPPGEANVVGRVPDPSAPRLFHMSPLNREKGFLDICAQWDRMKRALPGVSMDVVGGAAVYGHAIGHPLIPASKQLAESILQLVPESDIHEGRMRFYGPMGDAKNDVIRKCDVALLNPTGGSEAFPATPVECMWLGVPVVASDDFGMADSMRWFPELSIRRPRDIVTRTDWLLADPGRYRCMQGRSVAVAESLASRAGETMARWMWLIESLANGDTSSLTLRPLQPFHGSRASLFYRRHVRPKLGRIKRWDF